MILTKTRGQNMSLSGVDDLGDGGDLFGCLALTENHFGPAAALTAGGVDTRKPKVYDLLRSSTHAA
jgi:hypothetical protein